MLFSYFYRLLALVSLLMFVSSWQTIDALWAKESSLSLPGWTQATTSSNRESGAKNATRARVLHRTNRRRNIHPSLFAVWDEYNHLCILAKFQATFTITYETSSGSVSHLIDKMPANARSKGRCDQFDNEPVLDVLWKDSQLVDGTGSGGFTFRMIFERMDGERRWGVRQMQFLYNTGHPVFRNVAKPRKFIVNSNQENDFQLHWSRSWLSHSVLCPSPPPVKLYDTDSGLRVIARFANMQLQAYEFSHEVQNFDSFWRCQQVSFGSGVAHSLTAIRNDSLTFATGFVTVCIAALTVVGYAFYRAHIVRTEQYKNII